MKYVSIKTNLRHLFYYVLYRTRVDKYVFVRAFVEVKSGRVKHLNWGDDINEALVQFLTNKKVIFLPVCRLEKRFPINIYMVIGSVITLYNLCNTTIWGAGIKNDSEIDRIQGEPIKILAVRGPRTQKELQKKGIECPAVFGDPALLLPRYYKASRKKQYKVGIVPHYIDIGNENTNRLAGEKQVKLIKVQGYDQWTDFIDDICSCDCVVSSSLHGLIIAEAYAIPSVWVEMGEYDEGWEFKFLDFYESIGKKDMEPFIVNGLTTVDILLEESKKWQKGNIDLTPLLNSCPFTTNQTRSDNIREYR